MIGRRVVARLAAPAVFGLFDGLTALIGILLPLWGSGGSSTLVHTALGLALAEAFGMAAGAWLSDSGGGVADACVIGACTGSGTLLPVLPYAALPAGAARPVSLAVIVVLTLIIALVRSRGRGLRRALVETVLVLVCAGAAVYGGNWISGS